MAESSTKQELMDESLVQQDLVFLTLQYFRESQFQESLHLLESSSGVFFDMKYFVKLLTEGMWEEAEKYLSGFTKVDENKYSLKLFYNIREQKYLEALDKQDRAKAAEILEKELKLFSTTMSYKQAFEELALVLTLGNIRLKNVRTDVEILQFICACDISNDAGISAFEKHKIFSHYCDTKSSRYNLCARAKAVINRNPVFRNKLEFPAIEKARLQTLLRQSFSDQHSRCKNKLANTEMVTLFEDHTCDQHNAAGDAKKVGLRDGREEWGRLISLNTTYDQHHW